MSNQQIQMDLLSEDRSPSETLNYALARERGQASQQRKERNQHYNKYRQPMFQKNSVQQTTNQKINDSNTTDRTNTGLPKMRHQISARTSKHLSSQNEVCICHFAMQIGNAPTTPIQYATKKTNTLHRTTTKAKIQPTGTKTNTTEDEKHQRRGNRGHPVGARRKN